MTGAPHSQEPLQLCGSAGLGEGPRVPINVRVIRCSLRHLLACEQALALRKQANVGAALVQFEPALLDGVLDAYAELRTAGLEREGTER